MKKIFLILNILCLLYGVYGVQSDTINYYIKNSNDISLSDDKRLYNAELAVNLAKQLGNDTLINKTVLNYGNINLDFSRYIETIKILQDAIDNCDFTNDSIRLGVMINLTGVAFGELSQNATALRYFKQALNIFEKTAYEYGKFETLNNIGLLYYYNKEYKKAKKYFLDIIENYKNILNDNEISTAYLNIANIYVREKNYKKAEDYYNKIIKNYKNEDDEIYCLALNGLTKLYMKLGYINKAYNTIIKTKNIDDISPKLKNVVITEIFADVLYEMDSINKARNLYTYAIRYAEKLNLIELKVELLKKQSKLYAHINKTDKSYKLLLEAINLIDSLKFVEVIKNSKLQEEFLLYEQEKNNLIKENNKFKIQEKHTKIKIYKQRMLLIIFIISFISLAMFVIIVISNHKIKIKHIKEANKLKAKYQKELAAKLEAEVNYKIEQFTEIALILNNQNLFLKDLKEHLDKIKNNDCPEITDIKIRLTSVIKVNNEKEIFYNAVQKINDQIITELKQKYPNINNNDIRLICLSKLNMSNKDIASLVGTSVRNIEMAKYRLKKKLNLGKNEAIEDLISNDIPT